ncbi:co-chaperone HscB [Vibrio sp. FNV 38]|nr:co-chaperone HscB [Vibrio sp. FNV 38]
MNYFELFGLPNQFSLDGSLLSSQFRELQKRFHPDNYARASERDRLMAVQKASEINDAYQTLKQPISRAEYILSTHNIELHSEKQTLQDPMFLMEQMELREELEHISSSPDGAEELFDFDRKVGKMYKQHLQWLTEQLDAQSWNDAADMIRKLKFVAKLKNEIERVEDHLLD